MSVLKSPYIPFSTALNGAPVGTVFTISGFASAGIEKNFAIELFAGPSIAFHMNARFGYQNDHQLVCNAAIGGAWGKEQRTMNPFTLGQLFQLTIHVQQAHFMIVINGNHILSFDHRVPLHTITGIGAKGDITIHELRIDNITAPGTITVAPPPHYYHQTMQQSQPVILQPMAAVAPHPPVIVIEEHHHHRRRGPIGAMIAHRKHRRECH